MTDLFSAHFHSSWLQNLVRQPGKTITGIFSNVAYTAKIAIPDYKLRVAEHYKEYLNGNLDRYCTDSGFAAVFTHFGTILEFDKPIELRLHDNDMMMTHSFHDIIKETGAIIIRNAYLDSVQRSMGHRNRFPQLNFHVDRSEKQPTHFSLYSRDPFDEEQKHPRKSSTLFCSSIVGHLQAIKENLINRDTRGNINSYTIFKAEDMPNLIGNILLEHAWNEPEGTGELSVIDNITCLHASYYRHPFEKGYKIGVRYIG